MHGDGVRYLCLGAYHPSKMRTRAGQTGCCGRQPTQPGSTSRGFGATEKDRVVRKYLDRVACLSKNSFAFKSNSRSRARNLCRLSIGPIMHPRWCRAPRRARLDCHYSRVPILPMLLFSYYSGVKLLTPSQASIVG